jgi:hypothetical protein
VVSESEDVVGLDDATEDIPVEAEAKEVIECCEGVECRTCSS